MIFKPSDLFLIYIIECALARSVIIIIKTFTVIYDIFNLFEIIKQYFKTKYLTEFFNYLLHYGDCCAIIYSLQSRGLCVKVSLGRGVAERTKGFRLRYILRIPLCYCLPIFFRGTP